MDLTQYSFVYNAAAHFAAMDKYPGGITTAILQNGFEGFAALCWALQEMSIQGELLRRDLGHEPGETVKAEYAMRNLGVHDVLEARRLVLMAVEKGLKQPGDERQEVDEVLLELQKKTDSR